MKHTSVIASVQRRLRAFLVLRTLLGLSAAVALAALAAVAADALLILPDAWRARAGYGLAAVAIAAVAWGVVAWRRLSALVVARRMEIGAPALGTALTNAVQLSGESESSSSAEILRRQAVEYGRDKARTVRAWAAARRGVLGVLAAEVAVATLWGGAFALFRDVLDAVVPRYRDPYGDHPPYSRLRIEVDPAGAEVLYGGQCEIRATASGVPVEKLWLVAEDSKTGRNAVPPTVMFRRPDQSHSQALTNLREETRYWVTDGRARSKRHVIRIRYTPTISFLEVRSVYPAYTARAPQTRKLTESGLEVPRKTVLTFRAGSNRPLASGALELTPILGGAKKLVPLAPDAEDAHVVTGSFEVDDAVAFSISLTDTDGLASQETRQGRVTVTRDMRPRIFVIDPGRHAVATPDVSIPVRVRGEDDYAVESLVWFRGLNRSIERPVRMKTLTRTGPGLVEAKGAFDLKDLGLKPGDHIEYFFEALDNFPEGPNVTTSRIYALDIISVEQYRDILRRMAAQRALFEQYQSLDNHLRRTLERAQTLRDKGRELDKKAKPDASDLAAQRKAAEDFRRSLGDYVRGLQEALGTSPLFDVEQAFRERLEEQQRKLERLTKDFDDMMEEAGSNAPLDLAKVEKIVDELGGLFEEMKRDVGDPVRLITAVVRLLSEADGFAALASRQKELAGLARRFEEKKGVLSRIEQMELQEIAAAQRQVRDGLSAFMERIPELLAKIPDDEGFAELKKTAEAFLARVRDAKIQDELDKATDRFVVLDGPGGYPPAQKAADKMMGLLDELEESDMDGMGEGALVFQPSLKNSLGNSLKQILSALRGNGSGGGGGSGFGLYGENVGLYGPDMELAGRQTEGSGDPQSGSAVERKSEDSTGDASDAQIPRAPQSGVRIERNAKFPLRYRNLVGEYFRVVAESQGQ